MAVIGGGGMVGRWVLALLAGAGILVSSMGLLVARGRVESCLETPLLGQNLLPNARMLRTSDQALLPDGWSARASQGAQLRGPAIDQQGFDYDGDGRSVQLIGIANAVRLPVVRVQPGRSYCVRVRALSDSRSTTRLRLLLEWRDANNTLVARMHTDWQPVVRWSQAAPPADWSQIGAAGMAPLHAVQLVVAVEPSSDDRVYLDQVRVLAGGQPTLVAEAVPESSVRLGAWPNGMRGALSFSFDWETAMGGLIHSRSADDPYADQNPLLRAMRMREGITTTLTLFRPYGIRATYFANGYNFLLGNTERRSFLGNPIFTWARTEPPYAWRTDLWTKQPWFAPDPYGTVQSDPGWYFGDLTVPLQAEQQDIQSHTFSHLYAGFATPEELALDSAEWVRVAAERSVPPAHVLAFPWSGSAGMSDTSWQVLEQVGISAVTRTNRSQNQYQLVSARDPHCSPVPGHERILACPDFYLTPRTAPQALMLIDTIIAEEGMIDLWAHTEEVTAPEQIAAWMRVVQYAASQRDMGVLWIAPLGEIASWQQLLAQVEVTQELAPSGAVARLRLTNMATSSIQGLTLIVPIQTGRVVTEAGERPVVDGRVILDLPASGSLELDVWPN